MTLRGPNPDVRARCPLARTALGACALGLALLAGCAAQTDVRTPATPQARAYTARAPRFDATQPEQRLVPCARVQRAWWRLYRNPGLDAVVARALRGNLDLAAAGARLAQARALVAAADGALAPRLELQAGAGRQRYGAEFFGNSAPQPPFTYYALGLDASWDPDLAGGARAALRGRQALAEAQRQRVAAAALEVSAESVELSIDAAALRAQRARLRAVLRADTQRLQLLRRARALGAVGGAAPLAAQARLAADAAQLPALEQRLDATRHALAVLLGEPPDAARLPRMAFDTLHLPRALPLVLPSRLVASRPDILLARAELHAAAAQLGVAVADLYPHIVLSASFVPQSTQLGTLFAAGSNGWSLLGGLLAPVFDGGALHARARAARAAVRAAAAHYQATVLRAFGQVADALRALQHDAEVLAARQRARDVAHAELALMRERLRAGDVGRLQLLRVQREAERADIGWLRARAARERDTAQLFLALGGNPAGA